MLLKYADDCTLLLPQLCYVCIEDKLSNMIQCSKDSYLQLNLSKSKLKFVEHVDYLIECCIKQMYLLAQMGKQGLPVAT